MQGKCQPKAVKARICVFVFLAVMALCQPSKADEGKFGPEADQQCPKLPAGSGYVWEWIFRIDWGHCTGRVADTHKAAFDFGIARLYGVMPPGMMEPETSFVRFGSVGGTLVKWYRATVHRGPEPLEYRTFTLLDEDRMAYLSVSVYADSESQMEERLGVVEQMKYR